MKRKRFPVNGQDIVLYWYEYPEEKEEVISKYSISSWGCLELSESLMPPTLCRDYIDIIKFLNRAERSF